MHYPQPKNEWKEVPHEIEKSKGNFYFYIDAIDGKHISYASLSNIMIIFFYYKKTQWNICNSLQYNLLVCTSDIGENGRKSDGNSFANSDIGDALEKQMLDISEHEEIGETRVKFPYVFVETKYFT